MQSPLIELKGVSKTFRQRDGSTLLAVDAASLSVDADESVALVGESGSGKTTLARLLLMLIKPDGGEIRFRGEAVGDMKSSEFRAFRLAVQPIFQDSNAAFNPRRNVRDTLAQALRQAEVPIAELDGCIVDILGSVRLTPPDNFLRRYPHELSGGQRQRLAIARALSMSPELVVADEPLSGADASVRGQILNLMLDLQRERHMAYLLITHDISIARAMAHRTMVMYRGTIVEEGQTSEILDSPRHPYTKLLLAAVPTVDRDLDLAEATVTVHREPTRSGCVFYSRCPRAVELCASTPPALRPVPDEQHRTACHLADGQPEQFMKPPEQ